MALYTMAYSVANILAPLLGTQVIDHWGYPALWSLAMGMALLAWAGFKLLEKRLGTAKEALNHSVSAL
jgi:predicted MFS family arabinose efflux permease